MKNHYWESFQNATILIYSEKVITISKLQWVEFPVNKSVNIELHEN